LGTVDESGVGAERADGLGPDRAPAIRRRRERQAASTGPGPGQLVESTSTDKTAGQPIELSALLRAFEGAISSDEHNTRTLRLLRPVLVALIVIVLGVAVIAGIVIIAGAGWTLASGLGLAVAAGAGTTVAARRRRPTPIQLPKITHRP